jgi:hypothetical protein
MSLPTTWIDRIFEKLTLVYGREFLNRWEGVPLAEVKADWAHELAGFEHWPEAIKHGLQNLPPDRAPTVLAFRDLCRKAPQKAQEALPAPKADPERVRAHLNQLRAVLGRSEPSADPLDWARNAIERNDQGCPVRPVLLREARRVMARHNFTKLNNEQG